MESKIGIANLGKLNHHFKREKEKLTDKTDVGLDDGVKEAPSLDACAGKKKRKKKQWQVFGRLRKMCASGSRQQHKEIPKMIQLLHKDSRTDRSFCLAPNELFFKMPNQ